MALAQTLKGVKRELKGKGHLHELRRGQMIPSIVYGQGREPLPIALEGRNLNRIFSHHGYSGLFSLELEENPGLSWPWSERCRDIPLTGK